MINNFSPENVISGTTNSIIPLLLKLFPNEKKYYENINSQTFKTENVSNFWKRISEIKNEMDELMFTDISHIAFGVFSRPHSTAAVERIFSTQNAVKNKERNRLHVETVSNLFKSKDY